MPSRIGDKLRDIDLAGYFPPVQWIRQYRRLDLVGDLSAGVIVAAVIAPQSMAY
jgi:MFS superfamily sulfate permease-like transporter